MNTALENMEKEGCCCRKNSSPSALRSHKGHRFARNQV
jgi:hypothetical protein